MELILAMDLRNNQVVHGKSGNRSDYSPLDWGLASTCRPVGYIREIDPEYLYIADLDRIEGTGNHDEMIRSCAGLVTRLYCDRGSREPADILDDPAIIPIFGTETAGFSLSAFRSGFLSVDIRDGTVIPRGEDPVALLSGAEENSIPGCIILDISSVGTKAGIDITKAKQYRDAYNGILFHGGGIRDKQDLDT
ncbi:MAG: nickel transporter, partial [Methanospirillaceae archaeon]|nr:nickel transporter [Methanospirillaceae archaeon]